MCGEVGVSPGEYFDLTMREAMLISAGYAKKLERESVELWGVARFIVAWVANTSGKTLKKDLRISDVFEFEFEKEEREQNRINYEQADAILDKWDRAEQEGRVEFKQVQWAQEILK